MSLSYLPALLTSVFADLAHWLQKRSAVRLPLLLCGILFAKGRRTVTSWFRAAGIRDEFRQGYTVVNACGREAEHIALSVQRLVRPLLGPKRLRVALDDTPSKRYGPQIEGAGRHHNPTPGPAGEKYFWGHNWVVLAGLAQHPQWGTLALPLQAQLYIRQANLADVPVERRPVFRTKLQIAGEQLAWLKPWVEHFFKEYWVVVDGGYAKRPFLKAARAGDWVVISRLRKDAALCTVAPPKPKGQRGPQATYGKEKISLRQLAQQADGWQTVTCVQYGQEVTKTVKSFLATWRPAGGLIRVVLVKEEDDWLPFFATGASVSTGEILEAMADRNALEQTNKDVKEVWGASQQQVRNLHSNIGCFNLNLWMYTLVEAWAFTQDPQDLVDRSDCPWDREPRRPSHADKRRALQLQILRAEIEAVLAGSPTREDLQALAERLLCMVT